MKKISFLVSLMVAIVSAVFPLSLNAAQIGAGDFSNPTVFDYNGLGLPSSNTTPIVIGANTYTTIGTQLRYFTFGCVDGECLGSDFEPDFIDIVLNTPVLRAGGWVGGSFGNVQFFDESDVLLGTVPITPGNFAGWEADAGLIRRIRINDTEANFIVITFDNLTTEQTANASVGVPATTEWGMTIFSALAGLGAVYYMRGQRKA